MRLRPLLLISFSSISVLVMAFITSIFSSLLDYIGIIVFGSEIEFHVVFILLAFSTILVAMVEDFSRIKIIDYGCNNMSFSIKEICYAVGIVMALIEIAARFPSDARFFIVLGEGGIYSYAGIALLVILSIFKINLHIFLCKIEYFNFLEHKYYTLYTIIICHGLMNIAMKLLPYVFQSTIGEQSKLSAGILTLLSYLLLYFVFLVFMKYVDKRLRLHKWNSNESH